MSISFACPECQHAIKAADTHAGKKVRCPKCSKGIVVPGAPAAPAEPAPESAPAVDETPPPPAVIPQSAPVAPQVAIEHTAIDPQAQHFHDDDDDDHDDEEHSGSLLGHKDAPHEDLIDMTPMVDIVFFLLIFFLTTSMTALQAVMNLPNPQKATDKGGGKAMAEAADDSDKLTVTIQDDDTFWIDDEQCFSDQDLRMKIQAAVADSAGKPLTLVVVGSADASHGAAIRVFDAGAAAQVGSISLLVKEDLEK